MLNSPVSDIRGVIHTGDINNRIPADDNSIGIRILSAKMGDQKPTVRPSHKAHFP